MTFPLLTSLNECGRAPECLTRDVTKHRHKVTNPYGNEIKTLAKVGAFTLDALITLSLVAVGVISMLGILKLPPAAAYTLMGVGGGLLTLEIAFTVVSSKTGLLGKCLKSCNKELWKNPDPRGRRRRNWR